MKRSLILTAAAFFTLGAAIGAFAQTEMPQAPPQQYDQRDAPQAPPLQQYDQRDMQQAPPQGMQQQPQQQPMMQPPDGYGMPPVPAHLAIQQGTYLTVRINQWLSSDRNQQGDAFFGSLAAPVVVNGIVVAQRGQTVSGRVSEAVKAGRVQGTSRLGLQLTELTLADGQQVPIDSQLVNRNGSTSVGRDAGAIGATTALGAIVGAGADGGRGAGIGAGAGAAAGILGVLLTRGNPTVIYPETVLTFRMERPIDIDTTRSAQAFRYVEPQQDYSRQPQSYGRYNNAPPPPGYYGPGYAPGYVAPYYGYGYGPGFSVYVGPGYYRGFYRGYYFRGGRW